MIFFTVSNLIILEDKPVFPGNEIYVLNPLPGQIGLATVKFSETPYSKYMKAFIEFADKSIVYIKNPHLTGNYSWTPTEEHLTKPPSPKRTFDLNGDKLPCPVNRKTKYSIDIGGEYFYFDNADDYVAVAETIDSLLTEARDKE